MLRSVLIAISVTFAAGLLFLNYYDFLNDTINGKAAIPGSLGVMRQYFNVVSPLNQLLALIAVIVSWKFRRARHVALGALFLAFSVDLLTFAYFYPRPDIIYASPSFYTINQIGKTVTEWSSMNWLRIGLCAMNVMLGMTTMMITAKPVKA